MFVVHNKLSLAETGIAFAANNCRSHQHASCYASLGKELHQVYTRPHAVVYSLETLMHASLDMNEQDHKTQRGSGLRVHGGSVSLLTDQLGCPTGPLFIVTREGLILEHLQKGFPLMHVFHLDARCNVWCRLLTYERG